MIHNTDCMTFLQTCQHYRGMIADIPDNIGLKYDGYFDRKQDYYLWVDRFLKAALAKTDILCFTYNAIHDHRIHFVAANQGRPIRKIIWTFTFGQYQDDDFTSCWRPIIIFGDDLNFNGIRTVSDRMLIGDKRAKGLRIPGNVWEYPRVVGNAKERRPWHPTQLPEALVTRLVVLCMKTEAGRTVSAGPILDPFLGSGTTGVICERLGVPFDGCEISEKYYNELTRFLGKKSATHTPPPGTSGTVGAG